METLVKDKVESRVKMAVGTARPAENREDGAKAPDRREEVDELLRIKRSRRIDADKVPCPSCGVVVAMSINRCPFCESDIAAETALARETTRRLRELSGELDAEHAVRTQDPPKRRGFFERLKYLFEGDPEPVDTPKVDPYGKRLLGHLAPGDSFKVIDGDGPWLKVQTMGSDTGWVYSTLRKV